MMNEILFISCAKIGNDFYCSLFDRAMTIRLDLNTGECILIGGGLPYTQAQWGLVLGYAYWDGALYFVDAGYKKIARYILTTKQTEYIEWNGKHYSHLSPNISLVTTYQNKMLIFPKFEDKISVIDMCSNQLEKELHLFPDCSYHFFEEKRNTILGEIPLPIPLFSAVIRAGAYVYLFSSLYKVVLRISLMDFNIQRLYLRYPKVDIIDVAYLNGFFYLLDALGNIYRWKNSIDDIKLFIESDQSAPYYYSRVLPTNKNVWILPGWGENIRIIDMCSRKSYIYFAYPDGFQYLSSDRFRFKYAWGVDDEAKYYLSMFSSNFMLTVNKKTGKEEWIHPLGISEEAKNMFFANNMVQCIWEQPLFDLDTFLDVIKFGQKYKNVSESQNVGKMIIEYVK